MNCYKLILVIVIFTSCNGLSQQKPKSEPSEINWEITRKVIQEYSYTKSGLIDTTYKTEYFYLKGQIGDSIKQFITNDYDNNNLTRQKEFEIININVLSEDISKNYDSKNNLILEIKRTDGVITSITKYIYNNLNQEIKKIEILKALEPYPKNWNFDSAVAHHNDKKSHPRYDTSVIKSSYDNQGNLTRQAYCRADEIPVETLLTLYSNGQKSITYGISPRGDTTSVYKYEKEAGLTKEIRETKIDPSFKLTTWYDRINKVKEIMISHNMRSMKTYRYNEKGNEIENISYK